MNSKLADMSVEEFRQAIKSLSSAELIDIHIVLQKEHSLCERGAEGHLNELFEVLEKRRLGQTR